MLNTPQSTERAHSFYEKAGFREVKEADLCGTVPKGNQRK